MKGKQKTAAWIVRHRTWILIAILLLAVWSVTMISHTRINYDLNRYLSDDTMTKRAVAVMEAEFGSFEMGDPEASRDLQNRVGQEMPLVMGISVAIVLAVLLLTSHAWLEPAAILFTLGVSILINMGTNFIFRDVSFITFAVSAILQLALSIDYAIMLLHTFNGYRDGGMEAEDAMREALAECFMRIASSALTTIAGLLSLLFMSFTIGFDIGIVLSKGIVISMVCVFLLMPSVILLLAIPLRKTHHRPIRLGGEHLAAFIWKARKPLAILLLLAVAGGFVLNNMNEYSFSESATVRRHADGNGEAQTPETDETAPAAPRPETEREPSAAIALPANPLVLLIPAGDEDADYDAQRRLVAALREIRRDDVTLAVGEIVAMVTTGAEALKYYTVADAAEMTGMAPLLVQLFFSTNGFGESVRADRLLAAAENLPGDHPEISRMRELLKTAQQSFNGPHYARIIMGLNFGARDPRFNDHIDAIMAAVRAEYGDDFYVTGTPMSVYDISNAFRSDLLVVNLITLLAILAIVSLSFRAIRLPMLLVLVIEGAIWISMGISRIMGQPIFFISYLIVLSIQMGATIDYAILFSDQYRNLRREGKAPREALQTAMHRALPTILTSGSILVTAGYIIGQICTIYYIASIGALLARGALISVLLVLFLLPALLAIFDRHIIRQQKTEPDHC